MCVAEGFPTSIFLVNEDLTRPDGVIQCRELSTEEMLKLGWRAMRIISILRKLPLPPF